MDEQQFAETRAWLAEQRQSDPGGYQERLWNDYCREASERLAAALLAELTALLRPLTLELRTENERARQHDPEDLIRSGLLALQFSLEEMRYLEWEEARDRALEWARQAMLRRLDRPL